MTVFEDTDTRIGGSQINTDDGTLILLLFSKSRSHEDRDKDKLKHIFIGYRGFLDLKVYLTCEKSNEFQIFLYKFNPSDYNLSK